MLNRRLFNRIFFVCLLLSLSVVSNGQSILDSKEIVEIYKDDEIENALIKEIDSARSLMFFENQLDKGIEYSKSLLKKTKALNRLELNARIHHILGFAYIEFAGDYEKGIKEYFKAKAYYDKNPNYEREINLILNIANAYYTFGAYRESIEYNLIGISKAQKVNDFENIAGFDNNLGACYDDLGENRIASRYWNKAADYYKEAGDSISYFQIRVNILSDKILNDKSTIINPEYISFLKDAIRVFNNNQMYESANICRQNLAVLYKNTGQYKSALEVLNQIEKDTNYTFGLVSLNTIYRTMAKAYRGLGNHELEAKYLWRYLELHDTVYTLQRSKAVAEVRTKYDSERKEIENQVLRNKEELNKFRLQNAELESRSLYLGLGIVGVVAVLVLAGFFISQRQRKVIANQKREVDTAYAILETKNNEIMDSINYAKRIQGAILPSDANISKHIPDSFVLYRPKDIVAGDFYWMEFVSTIDRDSDHPDLVSSAMHSTGSATAPPSKGGEQDLVLLAAADCTGHGVPGAMVSVVCNNGLNRAVREYGLQKPGEILDKTREIVIEEFQKGSSSVNETSPSIKDGMDIALVNIKFKKENNETTGAIVEYSGANNPFWVYRKDVYQVEEIKADKQPIGQFHDQKPFQTHTIKLNKGDTFYIFTDGFADQFGREQSKAGGKKLKSSNFKKLLLSIQHMTMPEQKKHLSDFFNNWKGELEQLDDVCVIGVRV